MRLVSIFLMKEIPSNLQNTLAFEKAATGSKLLTLNNNKIIMENWDANTRKLFLNTLNVQMTVKRRCQEKISKPEIVTQKFLKDACSGG